MTGHHKGWELQKLIGCESLTSKLSAFTDLHAANSFMSYSDTIQGGWTAIRRDLPAALSASRFGSCVAKLVGLRGDQR